MDGSVDDRRELALRQQSVADVLLEHLAATLARTVLELDPRISGVTVAVRKLRPPVPHALATSGVRIHRRRGHPSAGTAR